MVKKCFICKNTIPPLFNIPQDPTIFGIWQNALQMEICKNAFLCNKHFSAEDIITKDSFIINGKQVEVTRQRPILKKGAVPNRLAPENFLLKTYPVRLQSALTLEQLVSPSSSKAEIVNFDFEFLKTINFSFVSKEWGKHVTPNNIIFTHISATKLDRGEIAVDKAILINEHLNITVFVNSNNLPQYTTNLKTLSQLENMFIHMEKMNVCTGDQIVINKYCEGEIHKPKIKCRSCVIIAKNKNRKLQRQQKRLQINHTQKRQMQRKAFYLSRRHAQLSQELQNLKIQCSKLNSATHEDVIKNLPCYQKEVVLACIDAATKKNCHGNRYSLDWVYTCILIRIKSPKVYRMLRAKCILPLPSPTTISRYIKNIDSSFGFQQPLFEILKEKTTHLTPQERHGIIMCDEMKITSSKHFNKQTMQMVGFVDLGNFNNEVKNPTELGDHVCVFMFQPFRGKHVQALGCFLTANNVSGNILAKLVLECIILCENAGLFIDAVTTDGATWNRRMWTNFGITEEQPSCEHPCDSNRRLWMCSDFPHLLKCMRNRLTKQRELHVPEGKVLLDHWIQVIQHEAKTFFRIAHKLTMAHVHPENYQKMNTLMAFQFFSESVAIAMESYQSSVPALTLSQPSAHFARRVNRISDILNASQPMTAIRFNSDQYKELQGFLLYLQLWENCADPEFCLARPTSEGLKISIKSILEICDYLTHTLGYEYFMTARMNQDAVENFFSMMRAAGGCNTHPESIQVAQLFRLLSMYSLVQPPRGSNVSGGEILHSLVGIRSIKDMSQKRQFDTDLDTIVEQFTSLDNISPIADEFADNTEVFAYVSGYLIRQLRKSTKCVSCLNSLTGDGSETYNTVIILKSRGHLLYPSADFLNFLTAIEMEIRAILSTEIGRNTLLEVVEALKDKNFPHKNVGCDEHKALLIRTIFYKFITTRMLLACKREAQQRAACKIAGKKHAKLSKLL